MKKLGLIGGVGPESSIEYYRLIIKRFQERVKTREEWLQLFLHSKDMSARNTAMGELAQIAKDKSTSTSDRNSIILVFQQVIQSQAYWRFRFNVIGQVFEK